LWRKKISLVCVCCESFLRTTHFFAKSQPLIAAWSLSIVDLLLLSSSILLERHGRARAATVVTEVASTSARPALRVRILSCGAETVQNDSESTALHRGALGMVKLQHFGAVGLWSNP
jgi:hypothetical protein